MREVYIAHHGTKGQKWGVRNGPPYPLDKNGKIRSKDYSAYIKTGAIIVGTTVIAGIALSSLDSDTIRSIGKAFVDSHIGGNSINEYSGGFRTISDGFRDKAKEYGYRIKDDLTEKSERAINSVMQRTNPTGDSSNCIGTSATACLERMGLDVIAKSFGNRPLDKSIFKEVFKGYKEEYYIGDTKSSRDALEKTVTKILKENPEGSFGVLYGNGRKDFGHSVYWEILRGKLVFGESQDGYKYDSIDEYYNTIGKNIHKDSFAYGRVDNCEVEFSKIWKIAGPRK